jgi:Type II CAAX prenyl endopeptidase Rce1-like
MELVVDRTRRQAGLAIGGTWAAFCVAVALALPQPPAPAQVALGALVGAVVILVGFAAASRCRPLAPRGNPQRLKLAALSLAAGVALGAVLLGVLVAAAKAVPALQARFAGRLSEPWWRPWALGLESSVLEEVVFRLFAMSACGWLAARFTRRQGVILTAALIPSALLFGLAHLPAWLAAAPPSAALVAAVLLLNGVGGLLFGWTFWRWGLPYAIFCHLAGDVVIQSLGPRLLG